MEARGRTFRGGQHIVGNEMLDEEVTVSMERYEWWTGRRPGATRGLGGFDASLP